MKFYRLRKKVKNLTEMIEDLKEKCWVSADFIDNLMNLERKDILLNVENELRNCLKDEGGITYGEDIQKFVLTVYFHSPATYRTYFTAT